VKRSSRRPRLRHRFPRRAPEPHFGISPAVMSGVVRPPTDPFCRRTCTVCRPPPLFGDAQAFKSGRQPPLLRRPPLNLLSAALSTGPFPFYSGPKRRLGKCPDRGFIPPPLSVFDEGPQPRRCIFSYCAAPFRPSLRPPRQHFGTLVRRRLPLLKCFFFWRSFSRGSPCRRKGAWAPRRRVQNKNPP